MPIPVAYYPITEEKKAMLKNRYSYHTPIGTQAARYASIRSEILILAEYICANTPDSREQATALTKLDEVMFYANAAIARNEKEPLLGVSQSTTKNVLHMPKA